MNCKEAEKLIPAFLVKQLNNQELEQFLIHMEECPECMEELTIQYLVMTGTSLIEEGKSFDLGKALDLLLSEAKGRVQKWKLYTLLSYIFEALTIVIMIMIMLVVLFV